MRRAPFLALLVGVVLLSAGLLAMTGAVAQERQRDKALQHDASQVAAGFSSYFERARSLDLLLAQSPAFRPPPGEGIDIVAANKALVYLERLYPGAISEACLIDERGHELARVTEGVPAAVEDLSDAESQNAFFAHTLALSPGEVYQAPPYVSSDTNEWVISNSTRIRQPSGRLLIVHFEVSLASFMHLVTPSSAGGHVAVVDRASGRTVLQDDIGLPAIGDSFPTSPAADQLRSAAYGSGLVTVDHQRFGFGAVSRSSSNANDWVVVEWPSGRASFLPPWAGGAAAAVGAALILLFLFILQRQHSALRRASRLDHLTGLSNRKALEEALGAAVTGASQPGGESVAVLMLDLDGFKQVNDTLGHDKGDLVLQEIGRRLHANTFEYDTAARMGGDEFAVVLRRLREADAVATVAHRLREALVRPIEIDGVSRFIGVSIGAAVYGEHGRSPADLLRSADAAMYDAKRGREGVRVYDAGTTAGANASWLAAELLIAIENEEITLAYQPEFELGTGRVVGIEALARWNRGGVTPVPPSEFVVLAEQVGLIRQLTLLTLRSALDEAVVWREAGTPVPVSVNLSAQLVSDQSLPADIDALLAERGLDGSALTLEITETTVVKDVRVATEVLEGLRAIGIRIELDDFGSGYASFKALQELPLDGVKIDRSIGEDFGGGGQTLLAAAIDIGRRLGLTVVAEGIEDEIGLDVVRRLGAHRGQGYHLARPMSPEAIRAMLRQGSTDTDRTLAPEPL